MTVAISSALLQRIVAEAAASPELEVCGLLFGRPRRVDAIEPTLNVAADPRRCFEIDPAALLRAHRAARLGGRGLIGCYHSHPTGPAWPSATDAASAAGDGWLWLIVGGGGVRAFWAVSGGSIHGGFELVTIE